MSSEKDGAEILQGMKNQSNSPRPPASMVAGRRKSNRSKTPPPGSSSEDEAPNKKARTSKMAKGAFKPKTSNLTKELRDLRKENGVLSSALEALQPEIEQKDESISQWKAKAKEQSAILKDSAAADLQKKLDRTNEKNLGLTTEFPEGIKSDFRCRGKRVCHS